MAPSEFARLWYENVKKFGMLRRSTLQSFDYRTLVAAKALDKSITIAALSEDPGEDLARTAKILNAEIISPQWDMPNLNKKTIEKIHSLNSKIIPWTANDSGAWKKLLDLKVDGIISDDPRSLIKFLETQSFSHY